MDDQNMKKNLLPFYKVPSYYLGSPTVFNQEKFLLFSKLPKKGSFVSRIKNTTELDNYLQQWFSRSHYTIYTRDDMDNYIEVSIDFLYGKGAGQALSYNGEGVRITANAYKESSNRRKTSRTPVKPMITGVVDLKKCRLDDNGIRSYFTQMR